MCKNMAPGCEDRLVGLPFKKIRLLDYQHGEIQKVQLHAKIELLRADVDHKVHFYLFYAEKFPVRAIWTTPSKPSRRSSASHTKFSKRQIIHSS